MGIKIKGSNYLLIIEKSTERDNKQIAKTELEEKKKRLGYEDDCLI